jgi:hypothetical protein
VMHICNPCFLRGRGSRIKVCGSPEQKAWDPFWKVK